MQPEEARRRIAALGFSDADAETLFAHFDDAERRGKRGHGYARIPWLETLPDLDPSARAERDFVAQSHEVWDGGGALGYLTLAAICDAQLAEPPDTGRLIVARAVPDRRARLLRAAPRRRRAGRTADGDLTRAPYPT